MVNISDDLKQAFLNDRTKKNIEFEFESSVDVEPDDFSRINFYQEKDANDTTSAVVGYGYSNEEAYNQIPLSYSVHRLFPEQDSANGRRLKRYQKHAEYVYVDFYIRITGLSGIPTNSLVKLYFYGQNAYGYYNANMAYSLEILSTTYAIINDDYVHVTATIPLKKQDMTNDDVCFLNSNIYVQFYQSNGTRYPYSTPCSFTCYIKPQVHIQLGNDTSAFPYQNDVQVGYQGLNFDDYVVFNEYPDKFSRINFWNEEMPHDESRTNVSLADGFGVSMVNWGINDYLQDVNMYKISLKCKIKSFTPDSGVPTPIKYTVALYRKKTNGTVYGYFASQKDFQLNVAETFTICETIGELERYDFNSIYGIYVFFYKSNGQGGAISYSRSETASFTFEFSDVSFNLGDFEDEMPYSDTVQVEYNGLDINDYFVYPPTENSFTLTNSDIVKESLQLTEAISSSDNLKFGATESAKCSFETATLQDNDVVGRYFRAYISCEGLNERIPLGRFRVKRITKRGAHNVIIKHIDAYDGIYPLSRDGANWYSNYMGIVSDFFVNTAMTVMHIVPRQMFSCLYNVLDRLGIEIGVTNVATTTVTLNSTSQITHGYMMLKERAGYDISPSDYVAYSLVPSTVVSPSKKYRVRIGYDYKSELDEYFEEVGYRNTFGMYPSRGGIIIEESRTDGTVNRFSVNDGDWFAVDPDTTSIYINIPSKYHIWSGDEENPRLRELTIDYPNTIFLDNADFDKFTSDNIAMRLVYYNWKTKELASPSSMSYRDIIRSLVEITGHFFRYGRDGEIEFIRAEFAGLYPSNHLYPADDLYPRGGGQGNESVTMGKYRSFECADRETNLFGKIKIQLQTVNENEPSIKYYVGDEDKRNIYVMTDNVFYCASGVSYALEDDGTEPLPEVIEMLSNLYNVIKSVYYIPCEVDAIGMPWVECGDRIGLITEHGGFESFIFRRTLSGIQFLDDFYEALGDENTDATIEAWE